MKMFSQELTVWGAFRTRCSRSQSRSTPLGFYPAAACGIDHFRYIDGMTALAKTFMDRLVVLMDPHLTEMDRIFNSHRFLQHP